MKYTVASIISHMFEPMIALLILAVVGGFQAHLSFESLSYYLLFIFSVLFIPVIGFRLWFMWKKGLDWDIRDRTKRAKPLLVQIALTAFALFFVHFLDSGLLVRMFTIVLVWLVGFFLVTTQWKISGHASTLALVTGIIVLWYGSSWWPILATVALVSWSRVVRRDHTMWQVIVGALYGWAIVYISTYV